MSLIPEFGLAPREDDEGLFSRDIDGQLVRLDPPTEEDYGTLATLQVDGRAVQVPVAEPLKDAQGNIVLDIAGRTTPRYTTIFDAVMKLNRERKPGEKEMSIPTLCHQPHMTPVAVCRICVVRVYGQRKGQRTLERKLLPACQHQVKDGMEVFTMDAPGPDGDAVRRAVGIMTELLMADHLKPAPAPAPALELAPYNELQKMADRCGLIRSRFGLEVLAKGKPAPATVAPPTGHRRLDASSPVFLVDHSACILCGRCSRACNDVKKNYVIGRTGKGPTAGIGFDLDDRMVDSTCVQCGECMVSCPTSAITFKPVGKVECGTGRGDVEVPLAELLKDELFDGVPAKFLLWQKGLVVRRQLKTGEVLCRQGEPGHSAYIIRRGQLEVTVWPNSERTGLLASLGGRGKPVMRGPRTKEHVILGEMACLSGTPRTADISALEEAEVWEVRRNVLDRMMRAPRQRELFERLYRSRALATELLSSELFRDLPPEEYEGSVKFLASRLAFVRVSPGQSIFREGDLADNLYVVRLGHLRVAINQYGKEATVLYRGPGCVIGEIGLLAISFQDATRSIDDIDRSLSAALAGAGASGMLTALPTGHRTATCSALDHVELAWIDRGTFLELIREFPTIRRNLIKIALDRLKTHDIPRMREYVEQGLYQGQSLLVLDLTKCTRCDACTKACVQQHGTESHGYPLTRLVREGLRFGDFLVATSCRSCKDPYCMIGCPVDAIHRGRHLQIVIEDHCIGCGLCARNCPYGNISMTPNLRHQMEADDPASPGKTRLVYRPKAVTCDLCDAGGQQDRPTPRCVYACPHDAAHRMTGEQLFAEAGD